MEPFVSWLAALVLVLAVPTMVGAESGSQPFRLGFSRALLANVNDADAKASIRVWAQTVARERGIDMDPSAQLYDQTADMAKALQMGTLDAMSLLFDEYLVVSKQVPTNHWFLTRTAGEVLEHYILLVHKESEFMDLRDIRGSTLVFHDSPRTNLAMDWLDHLVIRNGHDSRADEFFGRIAKVNKISSAVLPVFFRKADAAVASRSGFETMCELNPQLRSKLITLATSRPLAPAMMCFRKDFESAHKERVLAALRELHTTAVGQQVLTLFQSEALVEVDEQPLRETAAFIEEARRMRMRLDADRRGAARRSGQGGLQDE